MKYDEVAMKDLVCPVCKSRGTLRPIPPHRRFMAGPWSFARLLFKAYECKACRAMLGTEQVIGAQEAA
jgi:hypothetical protein